MQYITVVMHKIECKIECISIMDYIQTSVIEEMDCVMFYNVQEYKCVKRLSIEYKILPNS